MCECADISLLRQFLQDTLSETEQAALAQHIEVCDDCQSRLALLADDTELRKWAENTATLDPHVPTGLMDAAGLVDSNDHKGAAPTIDFQAAPSSSQDARAGGGIDRFELVRVFAKGGLGQIWLARDKDIGRDVAVKELHLDRAANEEARQRFEREARLTGQLEHPNIVPVYAFGMDKESRRLYYAMRLVGGKTLREAIREFHAEDDPHEEYFVELQKLLNSFVGVCNAVAYAHSRGVVHRDLKPENVLLGEFGEVVVLDWGLAKSGLEDALDNAADEATPLIEAGALELTRDGWVLGTPAYMAPEQARGEVGKIDQRTDVYGLGAILYELLTGQVPHRNTDLAGLMREILEEPAPSPRAANRTIPKSLDAICRKALATAPANRYDKVDGLLKDIERFVADEPVSAHREEYLEQMGRWFRRNRAKAIAATVSTLAIAVTSLVAFFFVLSAWSGEHAARQREIEAREKAEEERDGRETELQRRGIAAAERNVFSRDFKTADIELNSVPPARRGWEWYRLQHEVDLAPHRDGTLGIHDIGILACKISPDEKGLATAGLDGRVVVWDLSRMPNSTLGPVPSRELVLREERTQDAKQIEECCAALAWLENGRLLAGASTEGRGVLWDVTTGERQIVLEHDRPLTSVAVAPEGTSIVFGDDRGLLIHVEDRDEEQQSVQKYEQLAGEAVMDIVFVTPNHVGVAQADSVLSVLDLLMENVVQQETVQGALWDLDLSEDSKLLAVACGNGVLRTFAVSPAGTLQADLLTYSTPPDLDSGPPQPLHSVCIDDSQGRLFAGDKSGRLLVWEIGDDVPFFVGLEAQAGPVPDDQRNKFPVFLQRGFTAVQVTPTGDTVFTAGKNTCIGHWDFSESRGIAHLKVGHEPCIRFDPRKPHLLWVASEDAQLSVWDTRTSTELCTFVLKGKAPCGLDIATEECVAVVCVKESVRFFRLRGSELEECRTTISHDVPLRNAAISPDASRVAAYDAKGNVVLWDSETAEQLGIANLGGAAVSGAIAFNSDSSQLAVAGAGQNVSVFETESFEFIKTLPGIAGDGATVLRWHPSDPNVLWAGDTLGTVIGWSVSDNSRLKNTQFPSPVVGLSLSPSGERVAAVESAGAFRVVDPKWIGKVLERRVARIGPDNPPCGLAFDSEERQLAIALQDGTIEIWDSAVQTPELATRERRWQGSLLLEGVKACRIRLRSPSVTLDRDDRIWIAYSTVVDETRQLVNVMGADTKGRTADCVLGEVDLTTARAPADVDNSLAVLAMNGEIWAAYRRPLPEQGPYTAQIAGYSTEGTDVGKTLSRRDWSKVPLSPVGNLGDWLHLLPGPNGMPAVFHLDWASYQFRASWYDGSAWKHAVVGRSGDGFSLKVVAASRGDIHAVFRQQRFNGDLAPTVYTKFNLAGRIEVREDFDHSRGHCSLLSTRNGQPVVVSGGVLATRTKHGWEKLANVAGNGVYDQVRDRYMFVRWGVNQQRILLITYSNDSSTTEEVWKAPDDLTELGGQLVVLVDSQGHPVIVAANGAEKNGWIRAFRTDTDLKTAVEKGA